MANPGVYVVHCYVERKHEVWQAFSMEFGLAAQGESCDDAKARLNRMIRSYLYDALAGEDKAHKSELLDRRAPMYQRVKYCVFAVLVRMAAIKLSLRVFQAQVPLVPATAPC